jgi:hypothetical protein
MPGAYYFNTISLIMSAPTTTATISFSLPTSMRSMGRELEKIGRRFFRMADNRCLPDNGGSIIVRLTTERQASARRLGEAKVVIVYMTTTDRTQLGLMWPAADGAARMVAVEMSRGNLP